MNIKLYVNVEQTLPSNLTARHHYKYAGYDATTMYNRSSLFNTDNGCCYKLFRLYIIPRKFMKRCDTVSQSTQVWHSYYITIQLI